MTDEPIPGEPLGATASETQVPPRASAPWAACLLTTGVLGGLLWVALDRYRWSGMEYPGVAIGGAAAAIVLIFSGALWSVLRSSSQVVRWLSALAMLGAVGLWALLLASLAFLSLWGFDRPIGEWAVSADGRRAAVLVRTNDDSGDPAWDIAVVARGAISRVDFRFENVGGGADGPDMQFHGDQLIVNGGARPVTCRPEDQVAAVIEQLQQLTPRETKRFGVTTSDCGNRVTVESVSPGSRAGCLAVRQRARLLGWSVRKPHYACARLVSPLGVPFLVWRRDRRTVVVSERYPPVSGFTSYVRAPN